MERMSEHTGLISSYHLLITAACTNTGGKMKGSHSRAADRCPLVLRHSLSQVTSFMHLGMLWNVALIDSLQKCMVRLVSSAYCEVFCYLLPILIPLIFSFSLMAIANVSTAIIHKYGDSGHPCLPPLSTGKWLEANPLFVTQLLMFEYSVWTHFRIVLGKPNLLRHRWRKDQSKQSKAFSKSIAISMAGIFSHSV